MALDTSAATVVTTKVSDKIRTLIVAGSKTAALLIASGNVQYGVKGRAAVLKMDSDVVIQAGTCGRNIAGDTRLSNVFIDVVPLKDMQSFCPKALTNTYFEKLAKQGTSPENGFDESFVSDVGEFRGKKVQNANEMLLWQGDTAIVGTSNLKWIDGIIKQQGATGEITIAPTATTMTEQLQSFISQVPIDFRVQEDTVLFVGQDTAQNYGIELVNKNLFKDPEKMTVLGTTLPMEDVPGLNGTNRIYMTRLSNLQLGLDGQGEDDKFDMFYSKDAAVWYMDFWWTIGIKVIEATEVFWADITQPTFVPVAP
jgi:hypothetical protein